MTDQRSSSPNRRRFLASVSALPLLGAAGASAAGLGGKLPFSPFAGDPPKPVNPLGWYFFQPDEVAVIEAIVDRFIPADDLSPGGKDCGCAIFIDRQLAGSYGKASRLYMRPPFMPGLATQGYQGDLSPTGRYREGLKALDDHARRAHGDRFAALPHTRQDEILQGLESGAIDLKLRAGMTTRSFFDLLLQNTMEGFFADPLYGGNKGMASWKMVGFPGARYDYRDHAAKHNVPYPHGPVSIFGEGL